MESQDLTVDLPLTVAAWEAGELDELDRAIEDDLTFHLGDLAEGGCESGGWPDDESVEVNITSSSDSEIRADVTIYFTEVIPSSCKDLPYHENRDSRWEIVVRAGESVGRLEYSQSDTSQWDLSDRNSAADGA